MLPPTHSEAPDSLGVTAGEPSTLVAAPFRPLNCSIRLALSALDCASFSALPVWEFSGQLAVLGALEVLVAETAARERS